MSLATIHVSMVFVIITPSNSRHSCHPTIDITDLNLAKPSLLYKSLITCNFCTAEQFTCLAAGDDCCMVNMPGTCSLNAKLCNWTQGEPFTKIMVLASFFLVAPAAFNEADPFATIAVISLATLLCCHRITWKTAAAHILPLHFAQETPTSMCFSVAQPSWQMMRSARLHMISRFSTGQPQLLAEAQLQRLVLVRTTTHFQPTWPLKSPAAPQPMSFCHMWICRQSRMTSASHAFLSRSSAMCKATCLSTALILV